MSVNQRYSIDNSKTQRMGKIFHTIDFERDDSYSESDYVTRSKSAICGTFCIDGKEFKLTYHELERINETVNSALNLLSKGYKLGSLSHR